MYVPRSKTVSSRRDPLAGGALDDTPINEYGCVSLLKTTKYSVVNKSLLCSKNKNLHIRKIFTTFARFL